MKKNGLKIALIVSALTASCVIASPEGDLKHLGYSQELIQEVMSATGCETSKSVTENEIVTDEANSTQEQLTELGVTRSLTPDLDDRSGAIRDEVLNYWDKITPQDNKVTPVTAELRATIEANLRKALEDDGYRIVQMNLLDLPEGSLQNTLRAVIRVTRSMKTRDSYKEIQGNLAKIKKMCIEAATIDGVSYLSELTTFVAENPRNNYYYEKTILQP